jgi:hypothetical protein
VREVRTKASAEAEIDAKIAKLQEKKRALKKKAGERVARIAFDAGLMEIEVSDEALLAELISVVERFRKSGTKPSSGNIVAAQPSRNAAGEAGGRNG